MKSPLIFALTVMILACFAGRAIDNFAQPDVVQAAAIQSAAADQIGTGTEEPLEASANPSLAVQIAIGAVVLLFGTLSLIAVVSEDKESC